MPILKTRHNHIKVWRPNGTRFAEDKRTMWPPNLLAETCRQSINSAVTGFIQEFGREPILERTVIEIVCGIALINVTLFELPEETE